MVIWAFERDSDTNAFISFLLPAFTMRRFFSLEMSVWMRENGPYVRPPFFFSSSSSSSS
jgi:hypothetical protein